MPTKLITGYLEFRNKRLSAVQALLKLVAICVISAVYSAHAFAILEIHHSENGEQAEPSLYYADLGWRTAAGVANALDAAAKVLADNPTAKIEFLVHGKDMRLFIDGATRRKPRIVALSNTLASKQVKFRVCDHALSFKGVSFDNFPDHFEAVDYVPERVKELRALGYQDLHAPPP